MTHKPGCWLSISVAQPLCPIFQEYTHMQFHYSVPPITRVMYLAWIYHVLLMSKCRVGAGDIVMERVPGMIGYAHMIQDVNSSKYTCICAYH